MNQGNCELLLHLNNQRRTKILSGKIKDLLDQIIQSKAKGDPIMEKLTKTKLLVKGIRVDSYSANSEDDPVILQKVQQAAQDFGIELRV